MEKLHIHNKMSPLFLLFISLLSFSSAYSNTPFKHFINCGSDSSVNVSGRTFVGDINSNSSFTLGNSEAIYSSSPLPNTSSLYRAARLFRQKSQFELSITQHGTYMVRLHFFAFESQGINLNNALFDVSTLNFSLLSKFRVQNSFPVIKEFFLTINVGKLGIQFSPSSFAFVNAIEVFLLPTNFIMDNATAVPSVKNEKGSYYGLLSKALQTIHRINVGGPEIKESNDSLWRNWMQDEGYVIYPTSAKTCAFYNGTLGEGPKPISDIAPDLVYRTCKEVKDNSREADLQNITWRFSVRKKTRHFVRFHFCNNIRAVFAFNLYIDGEKTKEINTYDYPNIYDLVVDSDDSGHLKISVGPNDHIDKQAYLNGLEIMEFVMNKSSVLALPPEGQQNKSLFIIIGSVGGVASVSILIFLIMLGRKWGRAKPVKEVALKAMLPCRIRSSHHRSIAKRNGIASPVPNLNLKLKISFAEIVAATKNFNKKFLIGEGGFGKVYKGILKNGMKVAVKRSDSSHGQGIPEFRTEVMVLSKIRHRHLVSLVGYCSEGAEMILVYEFMENGTLRDHLYKRKDKAKRLSMQSKLSWKQRLEICIGTAKGLHYLHTGLDGGIIHRDVKSTNILLDEYYVAKVADFGLSKSGPSDPDHFSMDIKGSFGYLDPEYFRTLQLTHKSDAYSFGVVLLEVLCARPPIVNSSQREEINLAEWGLFWQKRGELEKVIDPLLVGHINPPSLRKFGEIVENCLKLEGAGRPTMLDVCWDLEYALQLQQTAVHRMPHEDSNTDASAMVLPVAQRSSSNSFSVTEEKAPMGWDGGSNTTSALVESSYN